MSAARWALAEASVVLDAVEAGVASQEDAARALEHLAVLVRAGAARPATAPLRPSNDRVESARRDRLLRCEREAELLALASAETLEPGSAGPGSAGSRLRGAGGEARPSLAAGALRGAQETP